MMLNKMMKHYFPFILIFLFSCKTEMKNEKEIFLSLNEHKIHVKSSGSGSPIIFAHGGYLDLDMWNPQVKEFEGKHQLIRFSDLGHGKTENSNQPLFGYEIINELTKSYPNDKFVLVGLSWGAMLCVDFALNYPNKVEKLILVSPGLNGWPYFKDSLAAKNNKLRQAAIKFADTLKAAELFHQNWVIGPKRSKNELHDTFYSTSLNMIYKNMRNHWQEEWSDLDTNTARSRLENIQAPTYILVGKKDAEDIILIAEEYHQRIKKSNKIELDSVAHLINLEDEARFNKVLANILNE